MINVKRYILKSLLIFIFVLALFSCASHGQNQSGAFLLTDDGYYQWIDQYETESQFLYLLMQDLYFWNDDLDPNIDWRNYNHPGLLLEEMRNPEDRFSTIVPIINLEDRYLQNDEMTFGFEFEWNSENELRVTSVHNPELEDRGIRRGTLISEINQVDSYQFYKARRKSFEDLFETSQGDFLFRTENGKLSLHLEMDQYQRHSVQEVRIINEGNHEAIGYLALTSFTLYDLDDLRNAIELFDTDNVNRLIIDLRENRGGVNSTSDWLASAILGKEYNGEVLSTSHYNENQSHKNSEVLIDSQYRSHINHVIFLTSHRTASASEMLISNLEPYINVTTIGSETVGKSYTMIPILSEEYCYFIVSSQKRNANGDAVESFIPDYYYEDNIDYPYGDMQDPMIGQALYFFDNDF